MYKYVVPLYFCQLCSSWLSSQQRTRTFYGEHHQLAPVAKTYVALPNIHHTNFPHAPYKFLPSIKNILGACHFLFYFHFHYTLFHGLQEVIFQTFFACIHLCVQSVA